jgi:hypothetical protein
VRKSVFSWYADKIGQIFEIYPSSFDDDYRVIDGDKRSGATGHLIKKEDCDIVVGTDKYIKIVKLPGFKILV